MMKQSTIWLAALALAAPACKKHETTAGGSATAAKPTASTDLPAEVATWMPATAQQLLQGAWQTHVTFYEGKSMEGATALEVTGTTAKGYDGKQEHALTLSISAPCEFQLTEAMKGGGTASYSKHFLVANGKLAGIGNGAGGYRKGKQAVVCANGRDSLVTSDASGKCQGWEQDILDKSWKSHPVDCTWSTKDGKDQLVIGKPDDDFATKVTADGDLLWSDQLADEAKSGSAMKRATDYAAAKAWVDADFKANDPIEQAKAAGGKAGDTSTVAGLVVSYAADPSLKGKQVEVHGVYESSSSSSGGGKTMYQSFVLDHKGSDKPSLTCTTKGETTGLFQGDKVVVKGTVADFGGAPELDDCTITKAP